jgi:VanZ family protein
MITLSVGIFGHVNNVFLTSPAMLGRMTSEITPAHKLRSLWLGIGWLLVALVVYLSLIDALARGGGVHRLSYGISHLLAYGVLMLWFLNLYPVSRRPWIALGLFALGVGLEGFQGLTADREPGVVDAIANTIGIGLGWLLGRTGLSRALETIERRVVHLDI